MPCEISSDRASIDLWSDAEALEQQWIVKYPHPMVGEIGQVGLSCSFSATPARIQGRPLLVGEHTREILGELGFEEAQIDALFEAGAVNDQRVYPALAEDGSGTVESPWAPKK